MKKDCEEELSKLNQLMDKLNPPAEADFIKRLVDEVVSVKFKQANKLKKHWKRNFKLNTGTTNDYMSFDKVQINPILCSSSEHLKLKPISKTTNLSRDYCCSIQKRWMLLKCSVIHLYLLLTLNQTREEWNKLKWSFPYTIRTFKKKKKTLQIETCCKTNSVSGYLCNHSKRIYGTEFQKLLSYFPRDIRRNFG